MKTGANKSVHRQGYVKTHNQNSYPFAKMALFSAVLLAQMGEPIYANPQGGVVSAGSAVISTPNAQTTVINQSSNQAVIDWRSFNIASGELTKFIQPSSSSIALNRIDSTQGVSQIFGALTSNGKLILINPAGIYFGPNSYVNVGGLLATTANISNKDFMNNHFEFTQDNRFAGAIINDGKIKIADNGMAGLVAPGVENNGVIIANLGTVQLGSGTHYTVDFNGNNLITFAPDSIVTSAAVDRNGRVLKNSVSNTGKIYADGGQVLITASTAKNIVDNAINMNGIVEAKSISQRGGVITLSGGNNNTVYVSGKLTAHHINIKGNKTVINGSVNVEPNGFLETSGNYLDVNNMALNLGHNATWLIDPAVINIQNSIGSDPTVSYITVDALQNALVSGNVIIQTDPNLSLPGSGDINVNDNINWSNTFTLKLSAYRDINLNNDSTISNNAGGNLILQADNTGNGIGTIKFSANAFPQIDMLSGGDVSFYYNPAVFGTPTDYSNNVSTSGVFTPYMLVNNIDNLQAINNNLNANYALGRNIDASATSSWNTNINGIDVQGFLPLGNASSPFTGSFDGQGHTIDGLTMVINTNYNYGLDSKFQSDIGIFGVLSSTAHLSNLNVTNSTVQLNVSYNDWLFGSSAIFDFTTGGLVGTNNGIIHNSSYNGVVSGFANVGGIVGINNGTIEHSFANIQPATIYYNSVPYLSGGYTSTGGLVGTNNGDINTSYSTGTVIANYIDPEPFYISPWSYFTGNGGSPVVFGSRAGGFAGKNSYNSGTIENSYSTADVVGGQGELAGFVGANQSSIVNSYSTGSLSPSASFREMRGFAVSGGNIVNSFWDVNTSQRKNGGANIGDTLFGGCISPYTCTSPNNAQLDVQSTFTNVGWDFEDIWVMNPTVSPYPTFQPNTQSFAQLTGTPVLVPTTNGPYLPDAFYYLNTAQTSDIQDYSIEPIFVARKDCSNSLQYDTAKTSIIKITLPQEKINPINIHKKWILPENTQSNVCLLKILDKLEKNT